MSVRILLADDHVILRSGLRMLINGRDGLEVVAEAGSGEEGLVQAKAKQPDLAIVDITMPGGGGVDLTEAITASCPATRVLVLTMHDDQAYLKAALAAGARGFVVKRSADTRLLDAIETVMAGQLYIDPSMGGRVLQSLLDPTHAASSATSSGHDDLSLRERQVLKLLSHGYTNREAAEKLGLSMRSIETYRARLSDKLGFQSRVDLVRYALETGLLNSEDPIE